MTSNYSMRPCTECGKMAFMHNDVKKCDKCCRRFALSAEPAAIVMDAPPFSFHAGMADMRHTLDYLADFIERVNASLSIPTPSGPLPVASWFSAAGICGTACYYAGLVGAGITGASNYTAVQLGVFGFAFGAFGALARSFFGTYQPLEVVDDEPDILDNAEPQLAKASPTSYKMLPGGIELPELSNRYPGSVMRRVAQYLVDERGSFSEKAIAHGDSKICSQNDYYKIVEWALSKHLFKRAGKHKTAGVTLTKMGEWYFSELLDSDVL